MKRFLQIFSVISLIVALAACAPTYSSSNYSGSQVGVANKTVSGVITGKRLVNIDSNSNVGAVVGAVGGGIAGSAIGGGTRANLLGGLGGAVIGGLAGNAIEKGVRKAQGYEYIIRISKGNSIAVTQGIDSSLSIGQRVTVIYGDPVRVIPE